MYYCTMLYIVQSVAVCHVPIVVQNGSKRIASITLSSGLLPYHIHHIAKDYICVVFSCLIKHVSWYTDKLFDSLSVTSQLLVSLICHIVVFMYVSDKVMLSTFA